MAFNEDETLAGILGIDLDAGELRLAELVPSGAGHQLHAALTLPLGTADAVSLGATLKAKLKEVGFKASSAVIALAHDAFTAREVRHPDIPAGELPAIVQFQVLKEVAIPADEAVIDYVPLSHGYSTGEKRSLSFVVRKARVKFCKDLCEAAGLKLLAVVPRAIAVMATVNRYKPEGDLAVGVVCSNSFLVMHQGNLVFNRSMGSSHDLEEMVSEVRRSIAGYSNQPNVPPLGSVLVANAGLPEDVLDQLGQQRIPVQLFDPYLGIAGAERLLGHGDYAVACGAALISKAFKKPPVDFLEPKKVYVKPNRTRAYTLVGGVALASLALLIYGVYWFLTSSTAQDIAALQERIDQKKIQEKNYGDVEKRFDAVKLWKEHEIFILEEIYDLHETFPDIAGVQIVKAEWKVNAPTNVPAAGAAMKNAAASQSQASKTQLKPVARLSVKATAEQEGQLKTLETALKNSRHWRWVRSDLASNERNTITYELDVLPMKPEDYRGVITVGENVTATEGSTNTNRNRRFRPVGGGR
jgi:hypothetical protein